MLRFMTTCTLALGLVGCAAPTAMTRADMEAALGVASALEAGYAAQPGADPAVVAKFGALLSAAQAALVTWESSGQSGDQMAAAIAIAALTEYEVAAGFSRGH